MPEPTQPARALNPDAGNYPVSADPRDLAAGAEATAASFRDYPYWLARFPERGEAFSRSDSAWLLAVAAEGTQHCVEQVSWLGRVLAARGMPRLLLEAHLSRLAEALPAHRPADAEMVESLRAAQTELRARREELIDGPAFGRLASDFDAAVSAEPGAVSRCGEIIVSAVCDDADVPAALGALLDWLADPQRFSPGWLTAVETTVGAAFRVRSDAPETA